MPLKDPDVSIITKLFPWIPTNLDDFQEMCRRSTHVELVEALGRGEWPTFELSDGLIQKTRELGNKFALRVLSQCVLLDLACVAAAFLIYVPLNIYTPFMDNTYIAKSTRHGEGLFAKRKLKKGEIVTLVPVHACLIRIEGDDGPDQLNVVRGNQTPFFVPDEPGNPQEQKMAEEVYAHLEANAVAIGQFRLRDTCVSLRVATAPRYREEGKQGGYANDAVTDADLEKCRDKTFPIAYYMRCLREANGRYVYRRVPGQMGIYVAIEATRDIEVDEEVLVSYGPGYFVPDGMDMWMSWHTSRLLTEMGTKCRPHEIEGERRIHRTITSRVKTPLTAKQDAMLADLRTRYNDAFFRRIVRE